MPNYDERRYRAEEARRQIHRMAEGNVNRRTLDDMAKLAMVADALENQNERDEMRRGRSNMEYGEAEMRRGVPGSGRGRTRSAYDEMEEMRRGRSGNRSEYDDYDEDMEMRRGGRRRRDSRGRFTSEYDEYGRESSFMPVYPHYIPYYMEGGKSRSEIYPRYPYHEPPMMPSMAGHHEMQHQPQIGFSAGQQQHQSKEHLFKEMEKYLKEFEKHNAEAKRTGSADEKEHAFLEFKKFADMFQYLMSNTAKIATSPEEKNYLQQTMRKLQQEMQ